MTAATGITYTRTKRQFQGIFDDVWVVRFTLDTASIAGNGAEQDTVAVPGIRRATDVVLGYTHVAEPPPTDISHDIHVGADDVLHVISHNASGTPVNPASTGYIVVIGRVSEQV